MGTSTNGILAYGYDLGGGDEEWKIEGLGEYGEWKPEWAEPDEDGEVDMAEAVEQRLLTSVGFTETDWSAEGFWVRQRAAKALVPELVGYCSDSYTTYLLAVCCITAYRGDAVVVDFAALNQQRHTEDWDGKLKRALDALGITPKDQPEPRWLLVSYWG